MSFLGLEGYHVFVTGAGGGIGSQAVKEFLSQGCKVTAHDLCTIAAPSPPNPNLFIVTGEISDETSVQSCFMAAKNHHGPINILIAIAGIADESNSYPLWKIPFDLWQKTYSTNIKGTFLAIRYFLQSAEDTQNENGAQELENLAIVVIGSETGIFGQAGHADYASGKGGLQYGLVRSMKNEIVRLNSRARINAVAPGWVETKLIEGRLDYPVNLSTEAHVAVPLRRIAQPEDVARAVAFLASHRAAGHITGECLSVDGGMEGRIIWKAAEAIPDSQNLMSTAMTSTVLQKEKDIIVPSTLTPNPPPGKMKRTIQILLSVDFDAVSGWLGTGAHSDNNMADYSSGYFAGKVGSIRLLKLFRKHGIASSVTWFIPGHSMESFPEETKMIVDSGAEIACHGYAHEGGSQMTETQERDVIEKCVELATNLTGKKPLGWRAPLYQLREHTVKVLEDMGFLYDTSLTHHDSTPYFLPSTPTIQPISFSPQVSASSWMHPLPAPTKPTPSTLVEIPCNWYMEDMTPMQFLPHVPNSHGYVSPTSIETMWKDRFEFLYSEDADDGTKADFIFPLVLHPDTSGMAHVIGMVDRVISWLRSKDEEVVFVRYADCAAEWKSRQEI